MQEWREYQVLVLCWELERGRWDISLSENVSWRTITDKRLLKRKWTDNFIIRWVRMSQEISKACAAEGFQSWTLRGKYLVTLPVMGRQGKLKFSHWRGWNQQSKNYFWVGTSNSYWGFESSLYFYLLVIWNGMWARALKQYVLSADELLLHSEQKHIQGTTFASLLPTPCQTADHLCFQSPASSAILLPFLLSN